MPTSMALLPRPGAPRLDSETWDPSSSEPAAAPSQVTPRSSQRSLRTTRTQAEDRIATFLDQPCSTRILDPACGSGNFLYFALRRLLDLWHEVRSFALHHNLTLAANYAADHMPSPSQLFGIEIEFYAHDPASVVVWIGFLQWKHEHGILEDREPILQKLPNIEHADAILRYDADGKPYEPTWPQADYILGNPPFLGDKKMRNELGGQYVTELRHLYTGRVGGGADLVTFWFEKARAQISERHAHRAGLLATNSISMVGNRLALSRIKESGDILWLGATGRGHSKEQRFVSR